MKYTTIRISVDDKKRLEKLSRKLDKSIAETLRFAIAVADKETDSFTGDLKAVLSSLKKARDIGKTDAKKVDEYLYGSPD